MASSWESEQCQLLHLFPCEVWERILENAKGWKMYTNISSASPYFHALILPRRTQILFPDVVPFLLQSDKAFLPEALQLRQVCRFWKQNVDKFLLQQNLDYYFQFPHDPSLESSKISKTLENLKWADDFVKFERHFDCTHLANSINPFVHRGVFISPLYKSREDLEKLLSAMLEFFKKYGSHLWFLKFYAYPDKEWDLNQICKRLSACLKLMPNLRAVDLSVFYTGDIQYPRTFETNAVFHKLSCLQFVSVDVMPVPLIQNLLQANPQIKMVKSTTTPFSDKIHIMVKFYLEKMSNLTELEMHLYDTKTFEAVKNAQPTCSLHTLVLNASSLLDVSFEDLLRALEANFSQSLEKLHLQLPIGAYNLKTLTLPELKLCKLKFLMLKNLKFRVPLDFLLPMAQNLEELSLVKIYRRQFGPRRRGILAPGPPSPPPPVFGDSILELYDVWEKPIKSNMWILFPKLRLLRTNKWHWADLNWHVCTQDQWAKSNHSIVNDKQGFRGYSPFAWKPSNEIPFLGEKPRRQLPSVPTAASAPLPRSRYFAGGMLLPDERPRRKLPAIPAPVFSSKGVVNANKNLHYPSPMSRRSDAFPTRPTGFQTPSKLEVRACERHFPLQTIRPDLAPTPALANPSAQGRAPLCRLPLRTSKITFV